MLAVAEAVALAGLLAPGLDPLWIALLGFVLGGTFGLALLLLVLRAPDAEAATALSGMAQSVGYLVAAAGPPLFGLIHDLTLGWTLPLLSLGGVLGAKTVMGVRAGRPGEVPRTHTSSAAPEGQVPREPDASICI